MIFVAIFSDLKLIIRDFFSMSRQYFAIFSEYCKEITMDLKERIKSLCHERDISMNQLEQELSFGKGYISKLGKSTPNVTKLQKIADYFNVSLEYLINGEEKENANQYYLNEETAQIAQEIFDNKELRLLFSAARDSSPEDLKTTHEMLMALKRKEKGVDD